LVKLKTKVKDMNPASRTTTDITRWDLADILNPSSAAPRDPARDRKMSLDFPHHHGMYAQSDLDPGFNAHPDGNQAHHAPHPFENPEGAHVTSRHLFLVLQASRPRFWLWLPHKRFFVLFSRPPALRLKL
jgi:hypothetical protein